MIADEVMCGSGRSGTWRALEHDGVVPDIMSIAKGLAGGYIPLGATFVTSAVAEPILREHGSFMTGHTFSGHTAACAAGLAVQRIIERDRLLDRVRTAGAFFSKRCGSHCRNSIRWATCAVEGSSLESSLCRIERRVNRFLRNGH